MPKVQRLKRMFLGIDPGQSGGIACIEAIKSGTGQAYKIPSTDKDIWNIILGVKVGHGSAEWYTVLEQVHAMPKQGVSSTFKFGVNYGLLRMTLTGLNLPFEEVTPQRWQKALNITPKRKTETKSQWKNRLKTKAQQLFPSVDVTLATADALLIAEYCRRFHLGLL